MAATSFFLASFTPKTFSLSKPQTPSLPFSLSSIPTSSNSVAFLYAKRFEPFVSPFVGNVVVSSKFEQHERFLSEDEELPSFSPDLKLFVGNLPFGVDRDELAGLFANTGNVQMAEVIDDKLTGRSRGFGFVTMSTVEEVEAAAQQFNGYELEGRHLRVNAGPPPTRESTPRSRGGGQSFENDHLVHVGNLSWEVDAALKTLFSEVGDVLEARVIYDRDNGRSRGFGFVTYSSAEEVNNAIESLDGGS